MGWTLVSDRWSGGGRYLDDGGQVAQSLEPDRTRKKETHLHFALCVCDGDINISNINILSE